MIAIAMLLICRRDKDRELCGLGEIRFAIRIFVLK
jgi:hypothetical protein